MKPFPCHLRIHFCARPLRSFEQDLISRFIQGVPSWLRIRGRSFHQQNSGKDFLSRYELASGSAQSSPSLWSCVESRLCSGSDPKNNTSSSSASASETIPEDLAVEIRKLAHELSNALEVIVQTSYLLGTADLKEPAVSWLRMMDNGVQKAMDINLALRNYIKNHSEG
jgi:hypothetical protein